jgi:2,3-bisphosphoglycerate-dependent phosphoglycerate mutase
MLFLIRHGETINNVEKRFSGNIDTELTLNGVRQSINASKQFNNIKIDKIYCSKLKRTIKTANIIKIMINSNVKILQSSLLNERNYGILTGRLHSEVIDLYGQSKVFSWRRGFDESPPDGESLQDVYNRIKTFYETIVKPCLKKKENILVVTHGNVIRAFLVLFNIHNKDTITDIVISNCYSYFIV